MIVMLHVLIALSSLVLTSLSYVFPSKKILRVSYGLVGATLASGLYLVVLEPAHMVQSCTMGVAYLALASVGIFAARRRLTLVKVDA